MNDSDEQDLVKALDGVTAAASSLGGTSVPSPATPGAPTPTPITVTPSPIQVSDSQAYPQINPTPGAVVPVTQPVTVSITPESTPNTLPTPIDMPTPSAPAPTPVSVVDDSSLDSSASLDSIKQTALGELRPLVDKLEVSPEEKFDTYLLLIRSTDDKKLIGPAHEAAKAIEDETRRAEALLNIIKEIDYLSRQNES